VTLTLIFHLDIPTGIVHHIPPLGSLLIYALQEALKRGNKHDDLERCPEVGIFTSEDKQGYEE
jgi:hypothetical protein